MGLIELNLVDVLATALATHLNYIKNRDMTAYEAPFDLRREHTPTKSGLKRSAIKLPVLQVVRPEKFRQPALGGHEVSLICNTATKDAPRHARKLDSDTFLSFDVIARCLSLLGAHKPANYRHLFPISACAHLKICVHQEQIDLKLNLSIYLLRPFLDLSSASLAIATLHNAAITHSMPLNDDGLT